MLERIRRITKSRDFEDIFFQGRSVRFDKLFLKVREGTGPARFAVVVSKKVALKATQRNRIKRLLREALRTHVSRVREGSEGILIALPQLKIANVMEARYLVGSLLEKASLLIS